MGAPAATLPRALVTGASSGIGAVYAYRLAARGHDLVLVARDTARLTTLAADLHAKHGIDAQVLTADLSQADGVDAVAGRIVEDASIGLLVNNAGVAVFGGFKDQDPAKLDAMLAINITAVTRLAQAAVGAFPGRDHGDGAIINISSVVGLLPEYGAPVYGATKAYVTYLTQALALEAKGSGLKLQAVLPGATRTEIWERSGRDPSTLDPARVMAADELVDAALAGFDAGELVTIPSLPDPADWAAYDTARLALGPNLSHNHPAPRYSSAATAAKAA